MAFPPTPLFPQALDTDYTLYLVYDTTETRLSADNSPWAQDISIVPVAAGEPEIWADNGFGTIEEELFYYDSVQKNVNGKVFKLRGCARQLGGEPTRFNSKGTWVRGFVVAEHHNQLVDAIIRTQNFIGRNFDERVATLDWRIRNLQELDVIFDDYACPDVNFTFNVVENDPVRGVLAEYLIEATPPGSIASFRLDFGDGEFTTTSLQGEHRYAVNATIDPVVRISNDKCQVIQTPAERLSPTEPPPTIAEEFVVGIPDVPEIPDFNFVPCEVPEPEIILPPLITPCGISIEGQIGPIPSVIIGPNIEMVSVVTIIGGPIVMPSTVVFIDPPTIPSIILIDPPIPPTIVIDPPIPPTIVIIPPESSITLDLNVDNIPRLEVDWGAPPPMEVAVTMARSVRKPARLAVDADLAKEFGAEFADIFDEANTMQVEFEAAGIPSEIALVPPASMPGVRIDAGDLFDRKLQVECVGIRIPESIRVFGPDSPIPDSIILDGSGVPDEVDLVYRGSPIPVDASAIPARIILESEQSIPERIIVEQLRPIPDHIAVEYVGPHKIILEGPPSIPVSIPEGLGLPVIFPEKMPEVELVWRGAPIEVKLTMDELMARSQNGGPCVMLTPCEAR